MQAQSAFLRLLLVASGQLTMGKRLVWLFFFFLDGENMLCRICVLMPQPPKGCGSSCEPSPVGTEADAGRTLGMFQMLPDGGLTPHSESLWLL